MRRATTTETFVAFAVCMAGTSAATLLAFYYPDSNSYIYASVFTIVLLIVAGFSMARKKAA